MEYLIKAQRYVEDHGDGDWFRVYYTFFREEYSVKDSTWKALSWLYGDSVANELEVVL